MAVQSPSVSEILSIIRYALVEIMEGIKDQTLIRNDVPKNFSLEEFHSEFRLCATIISKAVTEIAVMYDYQFSDLKKFRENTLIIGVAFYSICKALFTFPKKFGTFLHNEIMLVVNDIYLSLSNFFKEVDLKLFKGLPLTSDAVDHVLSLCGDVYVISMSNLESVTALLEHEALLILNVLQEIHQVVVSDVTAPKFNQQIDNTEIWNNQDKQLLPSCILLIHTARLIFEDIIASMKTNGDARSFCNISELDNVGEMVRDLHISDDIISFMTAMLPPVDRELVKCDARNIAYKIRQLLHHIKNSHFLRGDQKRIVKLLKSVDSSNNKLYPLLSNENE
ncbi:UNVERIFIED_CONTAM: hypothetical protein PYX00_006303 [Menopon gallinae]|uniref:Uncharacterized protein n=1 Tax=Menopon gallinae TaxID=328185 RepID=A0AAW2HUV4_9NEOP